MANVKWLTRIEVMDRRFAGRFMARDYVTIREEQRGGQTVWTFTPSGHDRLKSAPAKVIRRGGRYTIIGVAGARRSRAVEVRIDDGPWQAASLDGHAPARTAAATPGGSGRSTGGRPRRATTRVTSRAFDVDGNVQPAPNDPFLPPADVLGEQRPDHPADPHRLSLDPPMVLVVGVCRTSKGAL